MEEDKSNMEELLQARGVSEEIILKFREEKIDCTVAGLMTTEELKTYLPNYGDCIALKHFCNHRTHQINAKQSLIERLRNKVNKRRGDLPSTSKAGTSSRQSGRPIRTTRTIELGWLVYDDKENRFKQVRTKSGGGTRQIILEKTCNGKVIKDNAITLFFPDGKSSKGDETDFEMELFDFKNNVVKEEYTIQELFDITKLSKLRFYLACKYKEKTKCMGFDETDFKLPSGENVFVCDDNPHMEIDYSEFTMENDSVMEDNKQDNHQIVSVDTAAYEELINSILNSTEEQITVEVSKENFSSVNELLSKLQLMIQCDKINKFNIYRDDIFGCCIRSMRRKNFYPFYKISVKFSDAEGIAEGAIDEGGPTREMFRMVIKAIRDSQLFVGNDKKHLTLNNNLLQERHYYEAGSLIALSLVHGGPGPHFFCDTLFSIIAYGPECTVPIVDDVDEEIKRIINDFKKELDINGLRDIITSSNVFSIAGCHYINNVNEKDQIIEETLKFFAVKRIEPSVAQFTEGLKTCEILQKIKDYPHFFKSLLCDQIQKVTSDTLENLFIIEYSEAGSNRRNLENRSITYFRDYTLDCEETTSENEIRLKDLLIFATGAEAIPPLGFPVKPKITFLHDNSQIFPMANTCSLELKIPTVHVRYEEFKEKMNFGIGNSKEFGFA